ncbi:MAG: Oligopeptide/dipeptide ABC transporter, ATPase subunit [Thermotoga sp. 50_1627]|uniref:ABC transporter ATP-binding protein n=1 Tax=Pseudothermotoga sp. TaxID=2033661 RepID=UPI00076BD06C|nr:MAG: Oligopeptide/dipeptide ABC transporter, ATPase subunit [Thermotoga sp. 50_64]KUK24099.1 MAG: Oligopeptide/dipeptide ABC transporter, ATPase subunit [Thermotoga sp. 50_1627]MBC7115959.1 ABC transporter ATP-binding protein [Pseudothermotoga sp.]HBT39176.1 ABC transporter ATP-binding protein [Pseudothermotoga sp.]HCO97491.1 ABC transporter ATP-binding protein [Pseudothermotoga sp.]
MKKLIEVKKIKAYYVLDIFGKQRTVRAVDGVDLDILESSVHGIAGESGCGKTTLLKVLFAAIEPPLRMIDGKVYYLNGMGTIDLYAIDESERKKLRWSFASYVPQGSMSVLNPVLKIKDTFRDFISSHLRGRSKSEAYEMAKEHLKELGLPFKILDAYPHQLSGGMRQRVTIALATVLKPKVIIADEPTTALDVVTQRGVIQLLKDIQSRQGSALVLVTHDMGVHANISDMLSVMYAGKIIEEGRTEELFENPRHPYTQYLIKSLPRFGDRSKRESPPGSPPSLFNLPAGCAFHPRCPFRISRCESEEPPVFKMGESHRVACWLAEG